MNQEPETRNGRYTWRPMVLWSAGILLALGLAWFVGAVVVPVWQVRCELLSSTYDTNADDGEGFVAQHGTASTLRGIRGYLLLPESIAPRKVAAVDLLGCCGADAVPVLKPYVVDAEHPSLQLTAARSLVKIGRPSFLVLLEVLGHSSDKDTRSCALGALVAIQTPGEAVPLLIDTLGDEQIGFVAAYLLAKVARKEPGALPEIEKALGSANPRVRSSAADSINMIGKPAAAALPSLERLLTDDYDRARAYACLAILNCSSRQEGILPIVLPLLKSQDQEAVRIAICAIIEIGPPAKSAEPELQRIGRDHGRLGDLAAEALKKIRGEEPPQ